MGIKSFFIKEEKPQKPQEIEDISSILNTLQASESEQNNFSNLKESVTGNLKESIMNIESIEDLYDRLGMSDTNQIYDVLPFIDSLPQSMDLISKKTSLVKILQAAKYDIEKLKTNAWECIKMLEQANADFIKSVENKNEFRKQEIENKLIEIENLEKEIEEETKKQVQQGNLFNEEISKLKTIKSYIE